MTRSPGLGFVAGGASVLIGAWQHEVSNLSGLITYSFPAVPFGPAGDKTVVVGFGGRASPVGSLVSATIDGVGATIAGQTTTANPNNSGFFYVNGITATSGTVTLTFSNAKARCAISVWSVIGNFSVLDQKFIDTYTPTSINEAAGGFVMACSYSSGNSTYAWSNVTEDTEINLGGNVFSSGSISPTATAAVTISATITNPGTPNLCLLSLAPS